MAVAFNTSNARNTSGGTTVSFSYTSSSGSDRLLLTRANKSSLSGTVNSATYAGASLTNNDTLGIATFWHKAGQATGANTLSFVLSAYDDAIVNTADFTGVDGTTPLGTAVTATGSGTAPATASITCPTDGGIWGSTWTGYLGGSATASAGSGSTLAGSVKFSGRIYAGAYRLDTGTLSFSLSDSGTWSILGLPINPVSGGAPTAALTGNLATVTHGTPAPALSLATTGNSATASQGTATPALSLATTGNAATASTGTPVASISLALTGNGATTAAGDVAVAGADPALTGSTATSSVGDVSPGITIALTGNAATASVGTVSPAISLALSGLAGTSAVGIVVPGLTRAITGNTATAAAGNVAVGGDASLALTGNAGTASAGSLAVGGALSDAEFRQMYDWLQDLYGRQLLTVGTFLALK